MLLNLKYEIFPTEEQKETLNRWLQYCRQTYNSALLDKQRKYRRLKQSYTREDMQRQLHEKVTHQRRDFLHKLSYNLSKEYNVIAVENLNIRSMLKNRKVSKSISDAGWGMFRNMLAYKCEKQGGVLIKVEPQYTSQDCSTCRERIKKSLSIRTHICLKCGTVLDRDHNASLNILQKGLEHLLVTN